MPVIFISYRRSDSQDVTGRIYDRLVGKYTQRLVLKDVDNIPLGVSFPMHLQQMIGKANMVLVIIGPGWLTATDDQGNRRLDDPADFVRVEVEASLRANIPVIPVLVSNARMPSAADLPPSMRKLVERNGVAVRPDPDFNNDINRLFSGIDHLERVRNPQGDKAGKSKSPPAEAMREGPAPAAAPKESSANPKRESTNPERRLKPERAPRSRRKDLLLALGILSVFALLALVSACVISIVGLTT